MVMDPILTKHIEQRNNRDGQPRAFIAGTRVRVQDIYAQSEVHGKTPEQIVVVFPHLSMAQVHAALSYYFDNREAILDEIRQDKEFVTLMKTRTGPGPLKLKLRGREADDAIPSG
jgi:uncharacterized protein (DUF433 family)